MLEITAELSIPDTELEWSFARSGGPDQAACALQGLPFQQAGAVIAGSHLRYCYRTRDLILDRKHVLDFSIVAFRPAVCTDCVWMYRAACRCRG